MLPLPKGSGLYLRRARNQCWLWHSLFIDMAGDIFISWKLEINQEKPEVKIRGDKEAGLAPDSYVRMKGMNPVSPEACILPYTEC